MFTAFSGHKSQWLAWLATYGSPGTCTMQFCTKPLIWNTRMLFGQIPLLQANLASMVKPARSTRLPPAYYSGLKIILGCSLNKMTSQIRFSPDILHFWSVNVIFHKYTIYLPTPLPPPPPDGQHQWYLW